jgi:hypothetical protein
MAAQRIDHVAVVLLGKKPPDRHRDHRTDVLHLLQCRFVGSDQRIQGPEVPRQIPRSRLADGANPERVDEARQGRSLGAIERSEDILRRLLAHSFERREPRGIERIEVGGRLHHPRIDQLVHQFLAQPFDVQRPPRGEMQQRLLALRRAEQAAGAARHRFVRQSHDCRTADGAMRRNMKQGGTRLPAAGHCAHHLGDHIAGTPHHDRVAHPDVLAMELVLVVQRRVGHRHAADEHWLQPRHRRDRAGAPDLHFDRDEPRRGLLGRKLVRDREPRRARDEPQPLLIGEPVHLVDHPIDVVRQQGTLG